MDNDDALENNQSEQEKESPQEDIPLWLQGIEDLEGIEDTNPVETSANAKDAWVKEISEELNETSDSLFDDDEKQLAQSQLPEWLREASEEESKPSTQKDSSEIEKTEPPIEVDPNLKVSESETVDQGFVELASPHLSTDQEIDETASQEEPAEDEFIEIPTLVTESPQDQEAHQQIDNGDELPQWLQEMISEPVENTDEDTEVGIAGNELDDLTTMYPERIEEVVSQQIEDSDREIPQTVIDTSEPEGDQEVLEKIDEITQEDETKPVDLQPVLEETPKHEVEQAEIERTLSDEQDHPLDFAKYQFDQGNIEQALEIFASLKDRPDNLQYLDKMEQILIEEVNHSAKDATDAWELLGDIALQNNKPDKAFMAFKQAIQLLLKSKEDKHGTD